MFTKIPGGLRADSGFSLRVLGRGVFEYSEGDKVTTIFSEILTNSKVDFVVDASSISSWKKSRKKIEKKDRQRILNNIRSALKFEGLTIQVINQKL